MPLFLLKLFHRQTSPCENPLFSSLVVSPKVYLAQQMKLSWKLECSSRAHLPGSPTYTLGGVCQFVNLSICFEHNIHLILHLQPFECSTQVKHLASYVLIIKHVSNQEDISGVEHFVPNVGVAIEEVGLQHFQPLQALLAQLGIDVKSKPAVWINVICNDTVCPTPMGSPLFQRSFSFTSWQQGRPHHIRCQGRAPSSWQRLQGDQGQIWQAPWHQGCPRELLGGATCPPGQKIAHQGSPRP